MATNHEYVSDSPPPRTARLGLFLLGFVVGTLFGYWLFGIIKELAAMDGGYPPVFDAYFWILTLVAALFVVLRRGR